ncbi:rod shape-determining protein RodA [Sporosalibacterium faouarense]|uniref:rod shape-determining protein RodA n=1 Tax=Sporosalibacterium faouarense TaxID=516123 RepID=UPI00141C058E|nr:rod shape-determining protein RodA [Sporosalibacterium faouarense]MTI47008.1 rod shape-determining protein RodA [Bacillota bacterium]
MAKKRRSFWKRFDYILLLSVILLAVYGLIMISSATANSTYGSFPYLKQQGLALGLGLIAIIVLSLIDYEWWGKLYLVIYFVCNGLLLAVLLFGFGEERWGARSWLSIGGFTFQPSEIVKIGIIISVAKYIDNNKENLNELPTLIKVLAFAAVPIGLIAKQPDAGTAAVYVFFIAVMLFIAGLDWKYILYSVLAGVMSAPILWFTLEGYQKNRILNFIDPTRDVLGSGYQLDQSITAIGSGKIFGRGLYEGVQTQLGFLPEVQTDLIFAVIGEELGLLGGLILITLYAIMLLRLVRIARNTEDLFGSLIIIGVSSMMTFHIFENIGMTMGLLPLTGIPLPFMSYGGTFLLVNMVSIGMALSVGIRKEGLNF